MFYYGALKQKQIVVDNMMNPANIQNRLLSKDIIGDEVVCGILYSKDGKVPGIYCFYNKVF